MSVIEAELVKLLKFKKSPEDYEDRQEYLEAITQTVDKVKDDAVFDQMTEPAYDWLQEAVEAHNKKREIPDFPDAEVVEDEESTTDIENEETGATEEVAGEADAIVDEEEAEEEEAEEEAPEEETAEEEDPEAEEAAEAATPEDHEPEGDQPVPVEPPAAAPKKPRKKKRGLGGNYIKKKKGKPDVEPKNKPGYEPNYKKITGKKDRYGVTEGTKAHLALKMFEKGCTMRDVNIELGDNYYVLLRRMAMEGHLVEKLENRVIRIIHNDDRPKKKGK